MSAGLQLPHGYRDAKIGLTAVAFIGELLQGELCCWIHAEATECCHSAS